MSWIPEFQRADDAAGRVEVRLGHPVVDLYLESLAARCRPNTVLAAGFDLKVFFTLFPVEPSEVTTADVLAFITAQRASGDDTVVRLVPNEDEQRAAPGDVSPNSRAAERPTTERAPVAGEGGQARPARTQPNDASSTEQNRPDLRADPTR